jgi:hypothetical protein
MEPAGAAGKRAERELIGTNQSDADEHPDPPRFVSGVCSSTFEVRSSQDLPRAPQPAERILKIGLDERKRRVDQFTPRNRDQIERAIGCRARARQEAPAKHLSEAPLRAVPYDRSTQLARRDDPETIALERVHPAEQRHVPRSHTASRILHRGELVARAKPGTGRELGHGSMVTSR